MEKETKNNREPLTTDEENIIKDILKAISDPLIEKRFLSILYPLATYKDAVKEFEPFADSIFRKLQNGRLIVAGE